ncbi:MAG: DUF815 domain-containing protein [Clostridia bacterium]|nr:DUF815 domain-containing protein [Clostridia bacterium]
MQGFSDYNLKQSTSRIASLLARLVVLRPKSRKEPFSLLLKLAKALSFGDMFEVISTYHELTGALIKSSARRISGDIWYDYLLSVIIEAPHEFALAAASGKHDESLYGAMRTDLSLLSALSKLSSDDLCRFMLEKQSSLKCKSPHEDSIARSSASLWSGTPIKEPNVPAKVEVQEPLLTHALSEIDMLSWAYDNAEVEYGYVCDEALEEIYHRFLQSDDWRSLTEDLWSFFASYGCGEFIKYKNFSYDVSGLSPLLCLTEHETLLPVSFYEMQHARVLEHTIAFMQGRRSENMLVTGGASVGKTELVLSVANDLPELRLVICTDENASLDELFAKLSKQPLRFMVLLDNMSALGGYSSFSARRKVPANVLLVATSRTKSEEALFPVTVKLPYPSFSDFVDIIAELLAVEDISVPKERLRARCEDFRSESKEKLTLSAAKYIADDYIIEF